MLRGLTGAVAMGLLLVASGCALLAKKTPTPAARIDMNALARLTPPANERYYIIYFASENWLHQPKYSHTWATLIRSNCEPGQVEPTVDVQTISWLPTKLDIDTRSRYVEPGTNVELHATIQNCYDTKQKIWMWGPYEVWHGFAQQFQVQKSYLDSGEVGYQCNDMMGEAARLGNGCDCIHAISDMDPNYPRWRYPLAFYGPSATANLVRRMMHSRAVIDGRVTHDWLLGRLGLTEYPIRHTTYRGRIVPHEPAGAFQDALPVAAPNPAAGPRP